MVYPKMSIEYLENQKKLLNDNLKTIVNQISEIGRKISDIVLEHHICDRCIYGLYYTSNSNTSDGNVTRVCAAVNKPDDKRAKMIEDAKRSFDCSYFKKGAEFYDQMKATGLCAYKFVESFPVKDRYKYNAYEYHDEPTGICRSFGEVCTFCDNADPNNRLCYRNHIPEKRCGDVDTFRENSVERYNYLNQRKDLAITVRKSNYQDTVGILKLSMKCFSPWNLGKIVEDIYLERYYVAIRESDNEIVGISGLCKRDDYIGYEIDYTCTIPEERGKGICTTLIKHVIDEARSKQISGIYWSALKLGDKNFPNAISILSKFGFSLISKNYHKYVVPHTCGVENSKCCPYRTSCLNCSCSEDLYYLDLKNN